MNLSSNIRPEVSYRPKDRSLVMVVEDEVIIRLMLAQTLRDAGYNVIETSNADEALIVFEATLPDIIVTDVHMPGSVDGMGLCSTVHTIYPKLPVIIVSAYPNSNTAEIDPYTKFLPKPYSVVHLVEVIQTQLSTST